MSSTVHNIAVVMTGNNTSLKGALLGAGNDIESFNKKIDSTGKSASQTGNLMKLGLAAGATAVAAGLAYAVGQAAAFDTQMRNVQSITKQSDASLHEMGTTLIGLSTKLPQSATTLAAGLYDIASSGFQGADGLKVLQASAEAASAGLTTTATSARAITAVLNAYGLTAKDATDVSDVLFQTVNLGVVSFDELAGNVGDVVGTAAAATVKIDEVGSAIATMTLAGISGAEATTALNRVLQSLIDPSDELSAALKSLGYESGAQALQVDTLDVVMEKLRKTSHGNIEVLQKWFPEIRSLKGALALMANEGKNYSKVVGEIQDKEARSGATRAALTEQLKAASAQWALFKNKIDAVAITVGVALLPVIINTLKLFTQLGSVVGVLTPLWKSLAQVGGDVVKITKELVDQLGPAASLLAGLIGLPVITPLNTFGNTLAKVTGFLRDNKEIAAALAALYAGHLLTGLLASSQATAAFAKAMALLRAVDIAGFIQTLGVRVLYLAEAFTTASGAASAQALRSAFTGLNIGAAAAVGGIALLLVELVAVTNGFKNAGEQAHEALDKITAKVDLNSLKDLKQATYDAGIAADVASEKAGRNEGIWGKLGGVVQSVVQELTPLKNTIIDNATAADVMGDAVDRLTAKQLVFNRNVSDIGQNLGILRDAVITAATHLGLDLTEALDPKKLADYTEQIGQAVLVSQQSPSVAKMGEALATVGDEASSSADKLDAFKKAMDGVLGIQLDLFNATTAMSKSLADLTKELQDGHAGFSDLTEAGRANRDAIAGATEQAIKLAQAIANQSGDIGKGVTSLQTYAASLTTVLKNAGYTQAQIDTLFKQMGLAPDQINTLINLTGADKANTELDRMVAGLMSVDGLSANPRVGVTDTATPKLTGIQSIMLSIAGLTPNPTINANAGPALEATHGVVTELSAIDGKVYTPQVAINPIEFEQGADALQKRLLGIDATVVVPRADLEIRPAEFKAKTITDQLLVLAGLTPTPIAGLNDNSLMATASSVMDTLNRIAGQTPTPKVGIDDQATWVADLIQHRIDSLHGKTITVTTVQDFVTKGNPNPGAMPGLGGQRWGGVMAFAGGGFTPAHVQRGQRIKYAEPETGGEAFIPRRGDHSRSMAVLRHAAKWYGMDVVKMAAGGIGTYSHRDTVSSASSRAASGGAFQALTVAPGALRINIRTGVGVDGDSLARKVKEVIEPSFERFVKTLTKELRSR